MPDAKVKSIRLNLDRRLASEVGGEGIRLRSPRSAIGVGDDVVLKERE